MKWHLIRAGSKRRDYIMSRKEIVVSLCTALLMEVAAASVLCQLAFFPLFSENSELYFHTCMYFIPFVATALYLKPKRFMICSVIVSVILCVHARLMPLDYYEMSFANPLVAILFTCGGALAIWLVLHFLDKRFSAQDTKTRSVIKRYVAFFAGMFLVSFLCSLASLPLLELSTIDIDAPKLLDVSDQLRSVFGESWFWAQTVFNWFTWGIAVTVTDIVIQRVALRDVNDSLREVFQRWLMVVVVGAFLVTTSLSYCIETAQAMRNSEEALTSHVAYLIGQVETNSDQQRTIRDDENNFVLSKARSVAKIIANDRSFLQSTERLVELRDVLELASITVCDGAGTVIADSDGLGLGQYHFGDYEQTNKYMSLLGGEQSLVEDARASIDSQGNETANMRVFAGVRRLDEAGFVQISIDANEYVDALSDASMTHLVDEYQYGKSGVVMVSHNGKIISSNTEKYRDKTVAEVFELEGNDEGLQVLLKYAYSGETMEMLDSDTSSIMYLKAGQTGDYGVYVIAASSDIFAGRTLTIFLNTMCYLVLFAGVFELATNLLDTVVVDGFKRTNKGLERITGGELDERINEHQTLEFDSLSHGINATVDALKGWINEAETRMERELTTAKAIQESALPRTFPPFPEIEAFDIYASMNAAKEVGGDFYDFFLIDDHTLGFLIADVSGKGVPASLFMMTAKTQIENYMCAGMSLCDAIKTANYHLCVGNDAGMFVTVWAATLDYKTGLLTYVNAGHNFPLLRHDGQWIWLKKKCGLFLGTFETAKYRQETITLVPGDELILYTDGVNEAFNVNEEEYGNDRLESFLAQHTDLRPRHMVEELRADVAKWSEGAEQSDDITMLCIEYGVAPEVTASITVTAEREQLDRVRGFIHAELGKRLCPIGVQNKIDIALEEMFVNVCNYAYAGQAEPGSVEISYVYTPIPSSLTVQIVDTGVPFDPIAYDDGSHYDVRTAREIKIGGLGIMMTRKSVDDFSYLRDGDKNVVVFKKSW